MRTLFIGSTQRGYRTLKALLETGVKVVGVISLEQDAHEAKHYEEAIRVLAEEKKIPFYQTKWMKDKDYARIIREELNPEIALVVGCRILLPLEIYGIPPRGTLAVHDSYLPTYRGFAPLNWSIINGENHTGVTLFYLSESTDGGDMVSRKKIPFGKDETAIEVYERVCDETVKMIVRTWPLLEKKKAPRIKQNDYQGNITCSRTPVDGCIDWNKSTDEIYNLIRALARPYPGAYTFLGEKRLMIWGAKKVQKGPYYVGRIPGRVIGFSPAEGTADVLTGDGILRIAEVQEEGKVPVPASEVIKSVKVSLGVSVAVLWDEIRKLRQIVSAKENENHGA